MDHKHRTWHQLCESLATARVRGHNDRARIVADDLIALADDECSRLWAQYLREAVEIDRLAPTVNHDLLLAHVVRAREVLQRLAQQLDEPNPAVDYAIAETGWLELHTALQVQSFRHPGVVRDLLDERLRHVLKARSAYARHELDLDARLESQPRWAQQLWDQLPLSWIVYRLRELARSNPHALKVKSRVSSLIEQELSIAQGYAAIEASVEPTELDPDDEAEFNRMVSDNRRVWRGEPGAAAVEAFFVSASANGLTTERFIALRRDLMTATWDAALRAAPYLLEMSQLKDAEPDIRADFIARGLAFLAEAFYRPVFKSIVDLDIAAFAATGGADDNLGGLKAHARDHWKPAPLQPALYDAVVDEQLIEIRNACLGHPSGFDIEPDGTLIVRPRRAPPWTMTLETLTAKATDVGRRLVVLFNAWNYVLPPPIQAHCPGAEQPSPGPG